MKKFRVVTALETSYVVHADYMVPTGTGVAFTVTQAVHGTFVDSHVAYVERPVIVYEINSVDFDKERDDHLSQEW